MFMYPGKKTSAKNVDDHDLMPLNLKVMFKKTTTRKYSTPRRLLSFLMCQNMFLKSKVFFGVRKWVKKGQVSDK